MVEKVQEALLRDDRVIAVNRDIELLKRKLEYLNNLYDGSFERIWQAESCFYNNLASNTS